MGVLMKKIITIGREYGSGGRTIGKLVAEKLNVPFYDYEIIDMAAKNSGLSADFIKENEQKISSGWVYNLLLGASFASPGMSGGAYSSAGNAPLADQVFNAQRKVIIELAKKGPCVIVGRCSDYILRHCEEIDKNDLLNIFIYADMKDKVRRAVENYGLDADTAEKQIKLIDKRRANHYNTFTERTWGNRSHYDMLINSSLCGIEKTADMIVDIAKNS
jgi:CMP/dCMP kinase